MGLTLPTGRRRRTLLVVAAVVALLVAVVLVVRLTAGGAPTTTGPTAGPTADPAASAEPRTTDAPADPPTEGATPAPASEPTPAASPEPTVEGPVGELVDTIEEVEAGQEHLAPVEAGEIAQTGTGVTVALDAAERVEAQASGPGEVAGPALALTVTLTNGGTDTLTLDDVVVNLYGQEGAPGTLFPSDPRTRPLVGELAPGARSTGTYVVSIPSSSSGQLIVSVFLGVDVPTPLFTTVLEES